MASELEPTDRIGASLPTPMELLGNTYKPDWDYEYVLPTSIPRLKRFGFTQVSDPINYLYGAQLVLVGRPRPTGEVK